MTLMWMHRMSPNLSVKRARPFLRTLDNLKIFYQIDGGMGTKLADFHNEISNFSTSYDILIIK